MRLSHKVILASLIALLFPLARGQAQTRRLVVCDGHKLWIVDGAEAIGVAECSGASWLSPLKLMETRRDDRASLTSRGKAVLACLGSVSGEDVTPVPITRTRIEHLITETKEGEALILSPTLLPPRVRAFFERVESDPPSMIVIISVGYIIVDKDDRWKYEENSRYTARIPSSNPTIREILEEAKRQPLSESLLRLKPHLFLMHPETLPPM